ncbi:hypothetical protein TSUD_194310 [Trifolium subterraneum]|uniref:PPM-type phosphatase domain-containing protein n=1 Tax=Trifolium subterraneum TaxID=3900 RepID=A0A2Z6PFZ7_TRISU|nr:hypothetical protein TSUD_194310 [Trifolium subterraneum]
MLPRICMKKPHVLENEDTTAWFTELERYHMGEFSTAAYQANSVMEDYSQVEVGDNSLFVGIYDGHNGTNAPKFISNYIFQELSRLIRENNNMMNGQLLREAVAATELKFTQVGTLYVASLGDSRVLHGWIPPVTPPRVLQADHLTLDHSCERRYNRRTLEQQFPDDPTLLLKDENGWKVKGLSKGIAKTLLRKALEKVAARVKMSYKDIVTSSDRKKYHDDMTIIVIFSDLDDYDKPLWKGNVPKLSYKSPPIHRELGFHN